MWFQEVKIYFNWYFMWVVIVSLCQGFRIGYNNSRALEPRGLSPIWEQLHHKWQSIVTYSRAISYSSSKTRIQERSTLIVWLPLELRYYSSAGSHILNFGFYSERMQLLCISFAVLGNNACEALMRSKTERTRRRSLINGILIST